MLVDFGDLRVVLLQGQCAAGVHRFAHGQGERELAEQRYLQRFGEVLAAAAAENGFAVAALRADVYRHIFQYAENRDVDFAEHIDCFTRID